MPELLPLDVPVEGTVRLAVSDAVADRVRMPVFVTVSDSVWLSVSVPVPELLPLDVPVAEAVRLYVTVVGEPVYVSPLRVNADVRDEVAVCFVEVYVFDAVAVVVTERE